MAVEMLNLLYKVQLTTDPLWAYGSVPSIEAWKVLVCSMYYIIEIIIFVKWIIARRPYIWSMNDEIAGRTPNYR
jgi:ABC-type enterobactin transport system permease subunit